MKRDITTPPSYWYSDSAEDDRGARVMEALRSYRAAEMDMRRRTQTSMSMGENELRVLRHLTRACAAGREVTPIDLARHLGVSTASITALLDRLERSGHLERRRHPSDRRKILVSSTGHADVEMRDTLASMHARMMQATRGMSDSEAEAVTSFLHRMQCAVADVCHSAGTDCCAIATRPASPTTTTRLLPTGAAAPEVAA
ncbi:MULTISPECIES: MarR family winged helix-turn-helix transcriptional regulator [Microbacterium]|uniref:MarR family winged helix-turn-helix transcriptional regulator n=1 Tax=Microbacterium TaxID=33882 RepID=UPI0027866EB7|nr:MULTISPECIES: MarR family transcriptional regulator [Microbacterium]MDQ1082990.1 DNA-binding MarR family transcriptional regulator [Microbacterium sp. SORGH_AS_0344]MDQ1168243.1 DNA-binding MarR family transcriptional regulator [Microbacterium proteolyticum]